MTATKAERKIVIKKILISFLICLALIVFYYWFVDRSIALWVNQHEWSNNFWLRSVTNIRDVISDLVLLMVTAFRQKLPGSEK